jgi:hypothetical protein
LGIKKVRAKTETQMIDLFVTAGIMAFLGHLLFLFDTTSTFLLLIMMMAFAAAGEARVAARAREHMPGDHLAPQSAKPAPLRAGGRGRRRRSARAAESEAGEESWGDVWARVIAPIVIAAALILSLIFTQLQPWQSAQAARRAQGEERTLQISIADLGIFTQLSTITRAQFLADRGNQFPRIENAEFVGALIDAARKGALPAIDDAPENLKGRLAEAVINAHEEAVTVIDNEPGNLKVRLVEALVNAGGEEARTVVEAVIEATEKEALKAVEIIIEAAVKEGLIALDDEPENLKLRLVVAGFYRAAAGAVPERRAEFMGKAREHTDEAAEIGPHIFESLRNAVEQSFAEGDLATIELAVARWKESGWTGADHGLFDARLNEARGNPE